MSEQPRHKGRFETQRKIEWKNNIIAAAKRRKLTSDVKHENGQNPKWRCTKPGVVLKGAILLTSEQDRDPSTMDISSMLEVQVKVETDVKENVTPRTDQASSATGTAAAPISQEESNFYKLMFGNDIASVRFRRIHCTACDTHIGSAPARAHNMFEHPVLRTLLCGDCRDFYGDGDFEQGDDATDMFCRWCANGGNLYCCSYCSNTFCYKCIRRNFSSLVRKKIEADEKWKCFVCNPSDLYSARAMCWALLQHIQTVTRILAHDKKMTPQEVEEKMNLDETTCCPRRSRRKRRRLESNSEEEDETYSPKFNGIPSDVKRKPLKRHRTSSQSTTNGVTREVHYRPPIPIRPRPISFLSGQSFNAESKSTISHENSAMNLKRIVLPSSSVVKSNTSLPSRFDPNALGQQTPLYRASLMNTSGSAAYIQTPVTVNPTRIILPRPQPQLYRSQQASAYQPQQSSSYQPQQASSYQSSQPLQSLPNTMVSIPNPVDNHGRPVFLLSKPKELNITPNIIELDDSSDSDDEPKVVTQQNNLTIDQGISMDVNTPSNTVVPVALTWENSDDDVVREEQPLREVRASVEKNVSFSEMMLPHSRELDKLLSSAKGKMYNLFDLNSAIECIEVEAHKKIKDFSYKMRDIVFQLVNINDRIVRQYAVWRRSQKTETSSSTNENALVSQENVDIPLDMVCINDSDTESECEKYEKYQIRKPSDVIKDNVIKGWLSCGTNLHHGVGDDNVHSADKATQVCQLIVSRDYEKAISYSVCTKTDQNPKTDDSASNLLAEPDKNFGKYEEQFIFYLQNIEDNGIETEDMEEAGSYEMALQEAVETIPPFISENMEGAGSDEMSLQKAVETNLPFISENMEGAGSDEMPLQEAVETNPFISENMEGAGSDEMSLQKAVETNPPFISKNMEGAGSDKMPLQEAVETNPPFISENMEGAGSDEMSLQEAVETNPPFFSENMEGAGSDEMSLQEALGMNPSFLSHLFQDTDLSLVSTDQSENCQEENEPNLSSKFDSIISVTKDGKSDTLDKNDKEIVNNSTTNTQETNMQLDDELQQMESQETHLDTTDREAIISDNNEANSNKNNNITNMEVVAPTDLLSNKDCTIIDD